MSVAELSLPAAQHGASRAAPLRKALNWRNATHWLLAWPVPLTLLLLWYVASRHAWIPPQVLPAPEDVAHTLAGLWTSGELQANLAISALRVAGGFGVGLLGGLALGAAMGLSPTLRDYVYPTFKAFSQVPVLGWLPLLMLLVGIDEALKVILIAKAAFVPVALNTYKGIGSVPVRYLEVARVLQLTRWQTLARVVLPAAAAPVWNGVRYGLTHAWLALVVVELLASSEGLGYMIVYGRQLFQLDMVLAAVVVVGVIGFALDKVLALAEGAVLRWRKPGF
ncbi:ABC transporter permease [Cupriavidus sp. IK-TO18]|uniref:ABC transporter permease n=1 Tax=Cupriavidus sp. IK-TO18 TaxID=2782182 RepID=UPI001899BD81|nr:ABC transporter permease [Cupriavidus sp. IK-TO18]MBF6990214.1 ABC transporter permease [Cupriavidus sp. IK-TO18]